MNLSEFLLARIAEDEEAARESIAYDVRMTAEAGPLEDDTPAYVTEQANIGLEYVVGVRPARVLAECEAKRRIVELCTVDDVLPGWDRLDQILGNLALPYADHPDYRDEWRP